MATAQEWLRGIEAWLQHLLGGEGFPLYREYPTLFWLAGAAIALIGGVTAAVVALRFLRRSVADFDRDLSLLYSRDGRKGLRLARDIRRGSRRVQRLLVAAGGGRRENQALIDLLENFTARELPETLAQARTFSEMGGPHLARRLEKELARQQGEWSALPDGKARDHLQKRIATAKQKLAQIRHADLGRARLLEGLEEAALALRALEVEMASLEATRSESVSGLRDRLTEMAEGLHHQREAHRTLKRRG